MGEEPLRLAFIGCGGMSRTHLRAWGSLRRKGAAFTVVGVADPVPALAAGHAEAVSGWQGPAPAIHADWRRMIEACRPDAVDVCTPHHLHHAVACGCLEAGVHVIVEKPIAVTLRAARRMLATAERASRVLAVAEQVRRWPGPRALAWAANGGPLGTPLLCCIQHVGGARRDSAAMTLPPPLPWRLDRLSAGGGVVMDIGVHMTDLLLRCFGPVRTVTATCRRFADPAYADGRRASVEDAALILLEFDSGLRAMWTHAGRLAGEGVQNNSYYGTGGSLVAPGFYPRAPRFTGPDRETVQEAREFVGAYVAALAEAERERLFPAWVMPGTDWAATDPLHQQERDLGVQLELADFLDAIRLRRPPEVGGAEGMAAQAVAAAILESAELQGQPLSVADVACGRISAYQDPIDAALDLL